MHYDFSAKNEASENPRSGWSNRIIAHFRVGMREGDQSNRILHLLELELGC